MITEEEYMRICNISSEFLKGANKKEDEDFPLKACIQCDKCGSALTAYPVKGKNAKYYKCNTKKCNVNINSNVAHTLLLKCLKDYSVNPLFIEPLTLQMQYILDYKSKEQKEELSQLSTNIKRLEQEIDNVDYKYATDKLESTIYQKVRANLTKQLSLFYSEYNKIDRDLSNLIKSVGISLKLSSNLSGIWEKGTLNVRQNIQRLVFPKGIFFNKENLTYRTDKSNTFYSVICSLSGDLDKKEKGQANDKADLSLSVARRGTISSNKGQSRELKNLIYNSKIHFFRFYYIFN
jgi:hypothetical protein